jgi:hypothetical protein
MNIKLINEITRINGLFQMLNESIEPMAMKFVKSIVGGMDEINFKKLFRSFASEEEQAYKTLTKGTSTAADIELAAEKLLMKINFSALAKHLLENKKLGTQVDIFVKNKLENFKLGNISKQEALADIETVFNTWAESQGIKELGPALSKKIKSKISNIEKSIGNAGGKIGNAGGNAGSSGTPLNPKVWDNLSVDAQKTFNGLNRELRLSQESIDRINKLSREIEKNRIKMSPSEILQIAEDLKAGGIALTKLMDDLSKSKDFISKLNNANKQSTFESLKNSTSLFNKYCNLFIELFSENKITMGILRTIGSIFKYLLKIAAIALGIFAGLALLVASIGYVLKKTFLAVKSIFCNIPYIGGIFCGEINSLQNVVSTTQSPTPQSPTPQSPTPSIDGNQPDTREIINW